MRYLFWAFACTLLLFSCANQSKISSIPTGWANQWPSNLRPAQQDSLSDLYYELHRDERNLYVHLQTNRTASQILILRHGLKIWLDPSVKQKEKMGFAFPVEKEKEAGGSSFGGGQRGWGGDRSKSGGKAGGKPYKPGQIQQKMVKRSYKKFSSEPRELMEMGFADNAKNKQVYVLGKDPCDIQVDLEIEEDNNLHYYAVVPLDKIFGSQVPKKLAVGIVSGFLDVDPAMVSAFATSGKSDKNSRMGEVIKMLEETSTPIKIWIKTDLSQAQKPE